MLCGTFITMRSLVLACSVLALSAMARPALGCVGDCNGDGAVAINELIAGVGIALGNQALSACPPFDADGNGSIAINELIAAVNNALGAC